MTLNAIINTVYTAIKDRSLFAVAGWTDGLNCDGSGTYSVNFSKEFTFTSQAAISLVKNQGLAGEETLPAAALTTSPATIIDYTSPVWAVAEVAGDTIDLIIGAGSNYTDGDGNTIEAQTLRLVNCLDQTGASDNLVWNPTDNLVWNNIDNIIWSNN